MADIKLKNTAYPTTMGVLIRRGNVPIKSSMFSNVAGNNFWVHGTMEY